MSICGTSLMVELQFSKLLAGVRFSRPAQIKNALRHFLLCGTTSQLLGLCGRIGRFFLIEDGKIPDYVVVESPVPHKNVN